VMRTVDGQLPDAVRSLQLQPRPVHHHHALEPKQT
jgi:hypothetical protein